MGFKRGITASLGLILAFAGVCMAKSDNPQRPDVWRLEHRPVNARIPSNSSTETVSINHDGDFLPGRNEAQDLGESTHAWRVGYFVRLDVSSGLVNQSEMFIDLSSGSNRGAAAGGFVVSTTTLLNGATSYVDNNIIQATGAPRNLICFSSAPQSAAGIGNTTTTLIMSATFYGFDAKGWAVSENIILSTKSISWSTVTVSNSSDVVRYVGVGNIAWSYISSFTVQITSMTDAFGLSTENPLLIVGYGQKIGLANNIISSSDVYKITNAGGGDVTNPVLNPLIYIDTTYDTIVFSPLPNGIDEKKVWYRFKRMFP